MGGWVTNVTPSILLGTKTPCQCTVVLSCISFLTLTRILSPSVMRIIGPGTMPL